MKKVTAIAALIWYILLGCTSVKHIKKIEFHYGYTELNGGKITFLEYDTIYNHK
jgi:hypothetical protein